MTCPSRLRMSRCHACGLRNSECHVCVRLALAGRRRSEIEKPRGPRTALDRAKGLEEDGAGPSDGGGERGIFKRSKGQGQARWAFRAWGSGGDGIYRRHTQRAVRDSERTAYLSTWQRLKQASCLTNSCTSHMLTVFITSNQIPLHVHAGRAGATPAQCFFGTATGTGCFFRTATGTGCFFRTATGTGCFFGTATGTGCFFRTATETGSPNMAQF